MTELAHTGTSSTFLLIAGLIFVIIGALLIAGRVMFRKGTAD